MYRIGIDIGGTSIKLGVVDEHLQIVRRSSVPFLPVGGDKTADTIRQEVTALMVQEPAIDKISSIGVVIPGSLDKTQSIVLDAHNLDFHNVPFRAQLQARFPDTPVYLANDADGAALAEFGCGAFKGCQTAVLLTLGTGVGGGVILGGKPFSGGKRNGAELGHMMLVYGGESCSCGNRGCVESYCSATALIRDGRQAAKEHPKSALAAGDSAAMTAKTIIDCAKAGDAAAKAVFDRYVDHLAAACASVIHILDPEVIALGGGVSHAGDFLFDALQKLVPEKSFFAEPAPIVPAALGNDAGIIGAAMLAQYSN